jgi:hypothetical protein
MVVLALLTMNNIVYYLMLNEKNVPANQISCCFLYFYMLVKCVTKVFHLCKHLVQMETGLAQPTFHNPPISLSLPLRLLKDIVFTGMFRETSLSC